MAQKAKRSISALDPHASYEAKARYYECYSTQELLAAGHLEEVGVRQYLRAAKSPRVPTSEEGKMKIELEFLDSTKSRVHEEEIIYGESVPIPAVGDIVWVESKAWKISKRDFLYLGGTGGSPDIKVSFWCEKP